MTTSLTANEDAITTVPQNSEHNNTPNIGQDVEKQDSIDKDELNTSSTEVLKDPESGFEDNSKFPKLSLLALFWFFFYNFGLFAWGGPVPQIALIKERLVIQDKWTTIERFQRVFAVYQILPGPEAAELCMFFGCLSAGKLAALLLVFAFILPRFTLILLASYLYSLVGFKNIYFNASFKALQPIVAAIVRSNIGKTLDSANE